MNQRVVTPQEVETRLRLLSGEIDRAHADLAKAEMNYEVGKADLEIGLARSRMTAPNRGLDKLTVRDKEDSALLANEDAIRNMAIVEAVVKAARANANRLRTQVDIARSIGTSVRTSMDQSGAS